MASTGTAVAPTLDLLVVDEAHRMRNPDTLLHRIGRTLGARRECRRNLAVYSSGKRQSLLSGNRIGPERCAKNPLPLIWQIPGLARFKKRSACSRMSCPTRVLPNDGRRPTTLLLHVRNAFCSKPALSYQITLSANWICLDDVVVEVSCPALPVAFPLESKISVWSGTTGVSKFG